MRNLIILITAFLFTVSFTDTNAIEEIIVSLKSGNSSQLSTFFDNTVEITLPEKSNSYSRNQAEVIIRDFFTLNQVKNFEILHKGENMGSLYCIGTLITKNGIFRTTIYLKQKGDRQMLQEIRFELN
jgi:hypothetical protein